MGYGRLLEAGWAVIKLPQDEAVSLMLYLCSSREGYPCGSSFLCSSENHDPEWRTLYLSPSSINCVSAWQKETRQ